MTGFIRKVIEASHTARIAQLKALESEMLAESRAQSQIAETRRQTERIQRLTTHPLPVYR